MNFLELDVHLSADGEVVIAHDAELGRMCGPDYQGRQLSSYNYSELPPIASEIKMHLSEGAYKMRDDEDGKFTLLRELFADDEKNGALYSIDMKDASNTLCQKVNQLVKEYKMENKVVWGSMFAQ